MIATNAFKQAVVGTYSSSDTVIELDSISNVEGDADYLPNGGFKLILYDGIFGNPADANNSGSYEIWECTSVNYSSNEVTVLRGQENTTAITIGAGASWQVFYGATKALLESLDHTLTNGSPTTFDAGSIGNRKVDLYYTYDYVNGVWIRKPKDLSQEPEYILETIDSGLSPNDLVQTYGVLKANQTGVIYFASGSMEVSIVDGRVLVDKWKPNTGDTVEFTGTNRPELTQKNGVWSVDVELERENLVINTKSVDHEQWNTTRTTTELSSLIAPTGQAFVKITAEAVTNTVSCRINGTSSSFSVDGNYSSLYYLKKINTRYIALREAGFNYSRVYDLDTGEMLRLVGTTGRAVGYSVKKIGDVYKISQQSNNDGIAIPLRVYLLKDPNVSFDSNGIPNGEVFDGTESVYACSGQFEVGLYSSNYIPTGATTVVRTAPSPVIPDALPATGVVIGEMDVVRDDGVDQVIFDSGGDSETEQSLFTLNESNEFVAQIFGSDGGVLTQANPFTWLNNQRKTIKYGISYDATNIYLALQSGGSVNVYTVAHDINTDTERDITLGNNSSVYHEYLGKSTDIPTDVAGFTTLFERMP